MQQGEEGNCAYLIQSGRVSIFVEKEDQTTVELAQMKEGDIFGEMALLFDGPRTASVRAVEDCNLILLSRQAFALKMEKSDPTVRAILKMLSKRIVDINNTLMNKKGDIDDLTETTQIIYQNILESLPHSRRRSFQNGVLPHLEEFMNAVKGFQEKFGRN